MKRSESGQVLNEAIVAMSIMAIGVVGIFGFITKAISQGRYIADQAAAVNLAAEGVEVTKNILDANALQPFPFNWVAGFSNGTYTVDYKSRSLSSVGSHEGSPYLLFDNGTGFYEYNVGSPTTFKRTVQITMVSAEQVNVTSRVTWRARNNRLSDVSITTDMFKWR